MQQLLIYELNHKTPGRGVNTDDLGLSIVPMMIGNLGYLPRKLRQVVLFEYNFTLTYEHKLL